MSRRKGRATVFRQNIPAVNIITQSEVQIVADNSAAIAQTNAENYTDTSVNSAFANMSGIVFAFAGTSAPTGWLLCDGSAISRTTYADLFARIGTAHGSGDGSTTFNLPDYRGRFLRGRDGGSNRDPDRASRTAMNAGGNTGDNVGTLQGSQYGSHQHADAIRHNPDALSALQYAFGARYIGGTGTASYTRYVGLTASDLRALSEPQGGNETRPLNANVNYIIKT